MRGTGGRSVRTPAGTSRHCRSSEKPHCPDHIPENELKNNDKRTISCLLDGQKTLCHTRQPALTGRDRKRHAGKFRFNAGQARADPGRSQQSLDRLGHCSRLPRSRRRPAFTYQGDALKKRVEPLAEEVDGLVVGHCDVTEPASIDAVFSAVKSAWGSLDFLFTPLPFPTGLSSTGAMSTPQKTISSRPWSSAAIRSRPLPSAPRN